MSDCGACLTFDGGGSVEFFAESRPKARRQQKCAECGDVIPAGAVYVSVRGKYEGSFWSEKLCSPCDEILNAFACGGFREYGNFWEAMHDVVLPELTMTNVCIRKLSVAGRDKLFAEWWNWRSRHEFTHESEPPSKAGK